MQAPFGYFRAEPFGWTDCAETDEGAIALYERPPAREWVGLSDAQNTVIWANSQSIDEAIRATEKQLMENNT
jgi:hypothetical protein